MNQLCKTRREMIEACGRLCQLLGISRSTGQIYGLLYLSVQPLSLDDIVAFLGISKASASTGTRHLSTLGAVRPVWVPGNRRDYFEAVTDLASLMHGSYSNFVKPRLASSSKRLEAMLANLESELELGQMTREEYLLCTRRLKNLSSMQKKLTRIAPLAEKLL